MDLRASFRKVFPGKLPPLIETMVSHQELKPHQRAPFGTIRPYGIAGWRTELERIVQLCGAPKNVKVICTFSDPDSATQQNNFVALGDALTNIAERCMDFQLQDLTELGQEPSDWSELSLELSVRDELFSTRFQWVGKGYGGPGGDEWHLFFEGLELKGIVPIWNDPAAKGFEDWEW